MKTHVLFLLAALALAACKTDSQPEDNQPVSGAECICGQPEAAILGCPNELCLQGLRNPGNPDCICEPLTIGPVLED